MSIGSVQQSRAFLPNKNRGVESCVKIAGLSALLAGIVYSVFTAQRFFFPMKSQVVPFRPKQDVDPLRSIYQTRQMTKNFSPFDVLIANLEQNAKCGVSALSEALEMGDARTAAFLMRHGADANQMDSEGAPLLHKAIAMDDAKIIEMLLDAGADIEAKDKEGMTPLIKAIKSGKEALVDVFIQHKANLRSLYQDKTPLSWAIIEIKYDAVRSLIAAGADPFQNDSEERCEYSEYHSDQNKVRNPYSRVLDLLSPDNMKFLKAITGTENHPAFEFSTPFPVLHPFFSVVFPSVKPEEILEWKSKLAPDFSFLNEEAQNIQQIDWSALDKIVQGYKKIDLKRVDAVRNVLIEKNPLFAKVWEITNRVKKIKFIASLYGTSDYTYYNHIIYLNLDLKTKDLARDLCRQLALALFREFFSFLEKSKTEGNFSRKEYVLEKTAAEKKAYDLGQKMAVFNPYQDQDWPSRIRLYEENWNTWHSEYYLEKHREEFWARIKELKTTPLQGTQHDFNQPNKKRRRSFSARDRTLRKNRRSFRSLGWHYLCLRLRAAVFLSSWESDPSPF